MNQISTIHNDDNDVNNHNDHDDFHELIVPTSPTPHPQFHESLISIPFEESEPIKTCINCMPMLPNLHTMNNTLLNPMPHVTTLSSSPPSPLYIPIINSNTDPNCSDNFKSNNNTPSSENFTPIITYQICGININKPQGYAHDKIPAYNSSEFCENNNTNNMRNELKILNISKPLIKTFATSSNCGISNIDNIQEVEDEVIPSTTRRIYNQSYNLNSKDDDKHDIIQNKLNNENSKCDIKSPRLHNMTTTNCDIVTTTHNLVNVQRNKEKTNTMKRGSNSVPGDNASTNSYKAIDDVDIFNQEEAKDDNITPQSYFYSKILISKPWIILMQFMTIFVLFIDDIRTLIISQDGDLIVDILLFISTGLFSTEILITYISQKDYRCGLFFYLDILSTLTIPLDTEIFKADLFKGNIFANSAQIARASRISRIGIRIARIIRFVRLIRVAKLIKHTKQVNENDEYNLTNELANQTENQQLLTINKKYYSKHQKNDGTIARTNTRRRSIIAAANTDHEENSGPLEKLIIFQKKLGVIGQSNEQKADQSLPEAKSKSHLDSIKSMDSLTSIKDHSLIIGKEAQKDVSLVDIQVNLVNKANVKNENKPVSRIELTPSKRQEEKKLKQYREERMATSLIDCCKPKEASSSLIGAKLEVPKPNKNLQKEDRIVSRHSHKFKTIAYLDRSSPTKKNNKRRDNSVSKEKPVNRLKTNTLLYLQHFSPTFQVSSMMKISNKSKPSNLNVEEKKSYTLIEAKENNQISLNYINEKLNEHELIQDDPENFQEDNDLFVKDIKNRNDNLILVDDMPKESRVGRAISESTIKFVVIIVLLVLLMIPIFDTATWTDDPLSYDYDLLLLNKFYTLSYDYNQTFGSNYNNTATNNITSTNDTDTTQASSNTHNQSKNDVNDTESNQITYNPVYEYNLAYSHFLTLYGQYDSWTNHPLILLIDNMSNILYISNELNNTRSIEQDIVAYGYLIGIFSLKARLQLEALLNISRILFICILLMIGTLLFSKDAQEQVIVPLERMIQKVNYIARNHFQLGNIELLAEEDESKASTNDIKETAILENAITKIATLLSLGFGEAGSRIITQNIKQGGDLEPFLSGNKVLAIFGFCDIRNFTDVTEILEQDVMVFVNSIANIVHSISDKYLGQANKNIGDAFLLVWKFPFNDIYEDEYGNLILNKTDLAINLGDLSVIAFLQIIAKIYTSPVLKKYREDAKILKRISNYQVKMGFGLDQGWAIEGSIGSEQKIDASYLSPHVNLSSRMEAATKQYGVHILLTQNIYDILSDEIKNICRKIDIVNVKGSKFPVEIYTVDIDLEKLDRNISIINANKHNSKMNSYTNNKARILSKKSANSEKDECSPSNINNDKKRMSIQVRTSISQPMDQKMTLSKLPNHSSNEIRKSGDHSNSTMSIKSNKDLLMRNSNTKSIGIPCDQIIKKQTEHGEGNSSSRSQSNLQDISTIKCKYESNKTAEFKDNTHITEAQPIKPSITMEKIDEEINENRNKQAQISKKARKHRKQNKKVDLFEGLIEGKIQAWKFIYQKKDLKKIIIHDKEFKIVWNNAMKAYINGNWSLMERLLNRARSIRPNDGPTKTLYNYIQGWNFQAPHDWPGYRQLEEK